MIIDYNPILKHGVGTSRVITLAQGSDPIAYSPIVPMNFKVLVLCAMELQHDSRKFPGVKCIYAPMDDDPEDPHFGRTWKTAVRAARAAANLYPAPTLVTCHAGLNRSGLVTAIMLHMLTGANGDHIIKHIRSKRPHALGNKLFTAAIRSQLK